MPKQYAAGVACIFFVAVVWTFATVLKQIIFNDLKFNELLYLTYIYGWSLVLFFCNCILCFFSSFFFEIFRGRLIPPKKPKALGLNLRLQRVLCRAPAAARAPARLQAGKTDPLEKGRELEERGGPVKPKKVAVWLKGEMSSSGFPDWFYLLR